MNQKKPQHMTLEEYMRGAPIPTPHKPKEKFVFGVYLSETAKKPYPFVVRVGRNLPSGTIVCESRITGLAEDAWALANTALAHYVKENPPAGELMEPVGPGLVPGSVTYHSDSERTHLALILSVGAKVCQALFFTSNPNWNPRSQLATKEEMALAGFAASRNTWLAPVVRPTEEFSPNPQTTFPEYRFKTLLKKFFR